MNGPMLQTATKGCIDFLHNRQGGRLHIFVAVASMVPRDRVPLVRLPEGCPDALVHVMWSHGTHDEGRCMAEAGPYLRAMYEYYPLIVKNDVVFFVHAHETAWHAPQPLNERLMKLLDSSYISADFGDFGGHACKWNAVFAASNLPLLRPIGSMTPKQLWGTAFGATPFEVNFPTPSFSSLKNMSYGCCATFFVQGWVLRQHPRMAYRIVERNLKRLCSRRRDELFAGHYPTPAGHIMEGAWHVMLVNRSRVTPPPGCF